jgi:Rps23 Pro-64 3,4-dihydroxylase Tpa1-like proline 4-hydroxylase
MNRTEFATLICDRLEKERVSLREEFMQAGRIRSCIVDGLLPEEIARALYEVFPHPGEMVRKRMLREDKYVSAQLNRHARGLEEITFAFQDPRVVALLSEITVIRELLADSDLYAGGLSLMVRGSFLNPHIDNSHDASQKHYRALNLLYYVNWGWKEEYGGNLELWDRGMDNPPRVVASLFNRLVIMRTDRRAYHSVSPVLHDARRCCVSNYFFSRRPVEGTHDYSHVTTFRARPGHALTDLWLRTDSLIRAVGIRLLPYRPSHIYKRSR